MKIPASEKPRSGQMSRRNLPRQNNRAKRKNEPRTGAAGEISFGAPRPGQRPPGAFEFEAYEARPDLKAA